jgi:RNA polymerase sigma factor (sigma-70 family)
MDKQLQEAVFNEVMNRYGRFILALVRDKFEGEDVKDVYQDFCVFLYQKIGELYSESANLFDTKAWLRTVTNNFCISEIRRRNGKKKLKFISEEKSELARMNYSEGDVDYARLIDENSYEDLGKALNLFLQNLSKRDALILKMKYFYGKPSTYISRKMNESHIDVYIGRLKERLKKKTGIHNMDTFFEKFKTAV